MTTFSNIKNLREECELTQIEVANAIHISQRAYSHYETGTRDIPISILIKLARYYDVSIDYLVGETQNMRRYR